MNIPFDKEHEALARGTLEIVDTYIQGRICFEQDNLIWLTCAALAAGDGDHLEIGTLYGGSAILVALAKLKAGLKGNVYCVDPLNGYYGHKDPSEVEVSPEQVRLNAKMCGVNERINLVQTYSQPWPKLFDDYTFVSAYIDGDHHNGTPLKDWMSVKDIVSGYVVFDNYEDQYPDVMLTCDLHAGMDPEWEVVSQEGITFIVKRIYDKGT